MSLQAVLQVGCVLSAADLALQGVDGCVLSVWSVSGVGLWARWGTLARGLNLALSP